MERTLVLIKPDAFYRSFIGRIITRLEDKGLQLIGAKLIWMSDDILNVHYSHLLEKYFFEELKQFMKSSPVLATVWKGLDCISTVRKLCGITVARKAKIGTIRGDWAMSQQYNLVHTSDSPENAKKEISLFFKDNELLEFERIDNFFIYAKHEV